MQKGTKHRYARCRCDCGNEKRAQIFRLRHGRIMHCGCGRGVHRHSTTAGPSPTFRSWSSMIERCRNPRSPQYRHYGGRGIKACARWADGDGDRSGFECFLSDMGERPGLAHSLDRIDNNGNYEPGNCRWATRREQNLNKRTNRRYGFKGKMLTITEIAETTGLSYDLLRHRIARQRWPVDLAIATPPQQGRRTDLL